MLFLSTEILSFVLLKQIPGVNKQTSEPTMHIKKPNVSLKEKIRQCHQIVVNKLTKGTFRFYDEDENDSEI